MKTTMYGKFVKRWQEVTDLPPQTVGPLTPYYKIVTRRLKVMPWVLFILGGIAVAVLLIFLFGSALPNLVTLLQRGF